MKLTVETWRLVDCGYIGADPDEITIKAVMDVCTHCDIYGTGDHWNSETVAEIYEVWIDGDPATEDDLTEDEIERLQDKAWDAYAEACAELDEMEYDRMKEEALIASMEE